MFILEEKELKRVKKANNVAINYRIRVYKQIIEFATIFETLRKARINNLR